MGQRRGLKGVIVRQAREGRMIPWGWAALFSNPIKPPYLSSTRILPSISWRKALEGREVFTKAVSCQYSQPQIRRGPYGVTGMKVTSKWEKTLGPTIGIRLQRGDAPRMCICSPKTRRVLGEWVKGLHSLLHPQCGSFPDGFPLSLQLPESSKKL